ncbi:MAG TPA: EamA family transporter [Candidatus Angelobacter sp.]|nr:EamA family transporter [Candidatus Angelobacter sp.]
MSTSIDGPGRASRGPVIAAFAAIYLIWGSTYLGIRFAVETLPPFLMGGARFLTAGLILYTWLRVTGTLSPSLVNWRHAALASTLLLGVGNGAVNWAEQKVSSGLTALIIAGTPVWFALFDWLWPGGTRPTRQTILGIAVGFAGVLVLVGSRSTLHGGATDFTGVVVLVCASVAWAVGSLYTKYAPKPESPMMVAAQQMIAGGIILSLTGLATGEAATFDAARVSTRSLAAFVYLTLIGSLLGFSVYAWLLKATTPARLSTYAYVNPVIAVFLGWALGGEVLTAQMLMAAAVIVFGVVVITARRTPPAASLGNSASARPVS